MAKGKYKEWETKEALTVLSSWAKLGLTDLQIAENIGINVKTLYDWKNKHSKICNALKVSKDYADAIVENSLYKRANGYSYDEITKVSAYNEETKEYEMRVSKIVTKQVIPDTTAQIYWLKNRKSNMWRDKTEVTNSIDGDGFNQILDRFIKKI